METRVKLKIQKRFIAAVVAVGLSASAHDVTVTWSNTNLTSLNERVLVACDDSKVGTGTGITYLRGLGVQMVAFLPHSSLQTTTGI